MKPVRPAPGIRGQYGAAEATPISWSCPSSFVKRLFQLDFSAGFVRHTLNYLFHKLTDVVTDVFPVILVISFFQIFVLQKPFPDPGKLLFGVILVILGLFIFIQGLETSLFPLGERMANQFALKGDIWWLVLFGFALGFSTTIAEPALTLISGKAGQLAAEAGAIRNEKNAIAGYVFGLRLSVAFAVGLAIAIGIIRIVKGWPLVWFIMAGYCLIALLTLYAPQPIIGLAYDSGGITTSTITVPLVTALGIGLASSVRGRSQVLDGFGLIALASLTPIIFVMGYGILMHRII